MKKVILLVLILNFQFSILNSLRAQGFEWVSTYTGPEIRSSDEPTNRIIGSCVDLSGNIYILGEFSPQAFFGDERLLPFDIITTPIQRAVVIAKLSQSGELLWHKAIYNGTTSCYAYALRMVGDSGIMAMVQLELPYDAGGYSEYKNLYYLDTLLTGNDDYLMPTDSVGRKQNAFISFDLDGNVTEQHFVCVGYTDSIGNILTPRFIRGTNLDNMTTNLLTGESFNIDADGNIYVIRSVHADIVIGPYDPNTADYRMWRVDDGTIGAMRIAVDGTHFLKYEIPHPTSLCNQQILKFSPHFDSLLDAVYMFDSTLYYNVPTSEVYSFEMDSQNNLYFNMEAHSVLSGLRIANSNSLYLGDSTIRPTWILKYNSQLEATGLVQLSYESRSNNPSSVGILLMYPYIDNNTNSLFVPGMVDWTETMEHIFYNDDTLDFANQTAFWLRLDKDNLSLLSYGQARSVENGRAAVPYLAAYNNRVFAQAMFMNGMYFGDMLYSTSNSGDWDRWLAIWDYSGRAIDLPIHFNVRSPENIFNSPIIKDSILYLTGSAYEDITFGDITTQNHGNSQAFIAKYVDPAFAEPYVHPSDRQEQTIEWQQDLVFTLADSPVTLTATATSGLPVSYTSSDSTIAYVEGDRLHLVADGHAWLTATQEGDYQYFPAEPVQRLLTVGNVGIATVGADGQAKAYPNPTSGQVTIDLAEIPPTPPLPYHKPGPSDSRDVDMVLYTSPGAPFSQSETHNFPYHQRYNMKVSGSALQSHNGVVTAWLTDMQGRREEVVLTPTGPDRYTLDLTSRPPAAYLLTVTTTDGRELTFRLMKQYGRK